VGTELVSVEDYRRRARARLPKFVFDYVDGGAEEEKSLARNRAAIDEIDLVPLALRDVSRRSLATPVLGVPSAAPYLVAPLGLAGLSWPQGDVAMAKAAKAAGIPYTLSTAANASLEEIAAASDGDRWFQLYVLKEREIATGLIRRARTAGFRVLVLTVDVVLSGKRERDIRNGFKQPLKMTANTLIEIATHPRWALAVARTGIPTFGNLRGAGATRDQQAALLTRAMDATLSWNDIAWLRQEWPGKLLVKGLVSPADAETAAAHGVDGIVLSNHGGRQLDGAIAPVDVLPEIVDAVGDKLDVLIDGGFRRGADIAKALALGAKAVLLGRAPLYGLGAAGEAGARAVLAMLADELDRVLALMGCNSPAELTRQHVRRRRR
jgi:(S)-mandelate dehydrogenase